MERNTISLPKNQIEYLKKLRKSAGDKPIVLVIKSGSAIDLSEISKYAAAIYGAKATNGVIIITTKKGHSNNSGKGYIKIEFKSQENLENIVNKIKSD